MPLLDQHTFEHLKSIPMERCGYCQALTRKNYCRRCDEFYHQGHNENCRLVNEHKSHRTYDLDKETEIEGRVDEI